MTNSKPEDHTNIRSIIKVYLAIAVVLVVSVIIILSVGEFDKESPARRRELQKNADDAYREALDDKTPWTDSAGKTIKERIQAKHNKATGSVEKTLDERIQAIQDKVNAALVEQDKMNAAAAREKKKNAAAAREKKKNVVELFYGTDMRGKPRTTLAEKEKYGFHHYGTRANVYNDPSTGEVRQVVRFLHETLSGRNYNPQWWSEVVFFSATNEMGVRHKYIYTDSWGGEVFADKFFVFDWDGNLIDIQDYDAL